LSQNFINGRWIDRGQHHVQILIQLQANRMENLEGGGMSLNLTRVAGKRARTELQCCVT
jgi:hypothetical protein